MDSNTIFTNEYLRIIGSNDGVFIETFKKGFPLSRLNEILSSHPEINLTNFNVLKSSINSAPRSLEKIGALKKRIVIEIVDNGLKAYITFNIPKEELDIKNREKLITEIVKELKENKVVFGIKNDIFLEEFTSGKSYLVSEGIPPVNGEDSVITMYKLKDALPEATEKENVNYYDLKLINRVAAGAWLGERIEATDGTPGTSVFGNLIKPIKGKNAPLLYDKNTVTEVFDLNTTTLYSRIDGAVSYNDSNKIMVSNHLEITGDVDFRTGNINFDGYLTIKGTVADGFSVKATKDIEINGLLGLGNVKSIVSTGGSIFIKGGISAKNRAEISAAKDIYTKFVDNATINCGGSLHIGFYCINSVAKASELIIDATNGHIIGGCINVDIRVCAPTIGSEIEKKTIIIVNGFNRTELMEKLEEIINKIILLKNEQQKVKQQLLILDSQESLTPFQRKDYNDGFERTLEIREEVKELDQTRKSIINYLRVHGEGEICATKKIYPNCSFQIKTETIDITSETSATTFYNQGNEIVQI